MMTEESKKQILANFLKATERISDKKYQERAWIREESPGIDDFDDAVEFFFSGIWMILEENPPEYTKFELSPRQSQLLKNFNIVFEDFTYNNEFPEEFIDTPEWEKIMAMAREILEVFDYEKEYKWRLPKL